MPVDTPSFLQTTTGKKNLLSGWISSAILKTVNRRFWSGSMRSRRKLSSRPQDGKSSFPYRGAGTENANPHLPYRPLGTQSAKTRFPHRPLGTERSKARFPYQLVGTQSPKCRFPYQPLGTQSAKTRFPNHGPLGGQTARFRLIRWESSHAQPSRLRRGAAPPAFPRTSSPGALGCSSGPRAGWSS